MLEVASGGAIASVQAAPGEKLSAALWLSGQIPPNPLCNGLGRCGRCRVRFVAAPPVPCPEELAVLTEGELTAGWRLACRHTVPEGDFLRLELPRGQTVGQKEIRPEVASTEAFLGIDLGTTSVQWRLVSGQGEALAEGAFWNPQGGAGADVISRIQAAAELSGLERLSGLIRSSFSRLVRQLEYSGARLRRACVAANSAMTEILLQADIGGLLGAPWSLSVEGGEVLNLPLREEGRPLPVVIPPLPAPFVGGDISAGLWGLLNRGIPRPFLLVDMGTNAEVALCAEDGQLWLTSAPLGPALEGIGPCCGQPAGPGVITRFSLCPAGLMPHFYQDSTPERCSGISATGYISLLALLLNVGLMNADGALSAGAPMPIARKIARNLGGGRLNLPCGQYLTPFDIEALLKVKAALAVAVGKVLTASGLGAEAVRRLLIAGALGEHAQMTDLATLGFIPPVCASHAMSVGNSSLDGACLLAANPEALPELAAICQRAQVLNLAEDEQFLDSYLAAMRWGYQG